MTNEIKEWLRKAQAVQLDLCDECNVEVIVLDGFVCVTVTGLNTAGTPEFSKTYKRVEFYPFLAEDTNQQKYNELIEHIKQI